MRLINLMYDTVTCLTTTPLRMLSLLGSIIAIGGFSIAVLLVILRLTFGPQWAAEGVFMLFAVLFTFIGAQFIGMGLLGEYIGRIYTDVRARPAILFSKLSVHPARKMNNENRRFAYHDMGCLGIEALLCRLRN